jgi:hypothetical protein
VQALFMFPTLAACACLLRVGLGLDKYLVWSIISIAIQFARRTTTIVPPSQRFDGWPEWAWPLGAAVTLSCAFGLFVSRQRSSRSREALHEAAVVAQLPAGAAAERPKVQ